MTGDAGHLREDETDVLGTLGYFEFHQFFGGDDEGHFVGVARNPVDSVDQSGDLGVVAYLGQLFIATVHVSDYWLEVVGAFTVYLGHETQHAVSRGMLRTDVEGHLRRLQFDRNRGVREMTD